MNGREHAESDDPHDDLPEELQQMLHHLLSGSTTNPAFNATIFANAAGLPTDPATLQNFFATLQQAIRNPSPEIDWSVTRRIALDVAGNKSHNQADETRDIESIVRAFSVATLWLDEATELGSVSDSPRTLTRVEWVQQTVDTWIALASPVATSITQALVQAAEEHLSEPHSGAPSGIGPVLRSVASALFSAQLGHVVGNLSQEVTAGGDIGIPLFEGPGREGGTLIPSGVSTFAEGLEQPVEAVTLYLTVRELAHARIFRHTRWLRSHLTAAISDYAKGMSIDALHIEQLTREIDPSDTEAMQRLVSSGALIPPKTPQQEAAHERLETMLALVEGWVDTVTAAAVSRLPGNEAIAEMVRRRRAEGGPAEHAFSTFVGLELRPRRMREAAALWRLLTERGGIERRDALWSHPDLLPSNEELDHPARLLERLGLAGPSPESTPEDELDRALNELLSGGFDSPEKPDGESDDT